MKFDEINALTTQKRSEPYEEYFGKRKRGRELPVFNSIQLI